MQTAQHAARFPLPVWKKLLFAALAVIGFFLLLEGLLVVSGVAPAGASSDPVCRVRWPVASVRNGR